MRFKKTTLKTINLKNDDNEVDLILNKKLKKIKR